MNNFSHLTPCVTLPPSESSQDTHIKLQAVVPDVEKEAHSKTKPEEHKC